MPTTDTPTLPALLSELDIAPFTHDEERDGYVRWTIPLAAEGWQLIVDIGQDEDAINDYAYDVHRGFADIADPTPADGWMWVGAEVLDPAGNRAGMDSLFGIDVQAYSSSHDYLWTVVAECVENACHEAGVAPNRGEDED